MQSLIQWENDDRSQKPKGPFAGFTPVHSSLCNHELPNEQQRNIFARHVPVQVLSRNARTEAMRSQRRMLLANCSPVHYFPRKRSWPNRSWECSSSSGFQCISPCEASVSQNHKGSSLCLSLSSMEKHNFQGKQGNSDVASWRWCAFSTALG